MNVSYITNWLRLDIISSLFVRVPRLTLLAILE